MVEESISSAHFLRGYQGKCEKLHGHNWRVQVFVKSGKLDKTGMAIDFKVLRKIVGKVLEKLDHCLLNELPEFKKQNPSSELLAEYVFRKTQLHLKKPLKVSKVIVWETDKSNASYSP